MFTGGIRIDGGFILNEFLIIMNNNIEELKEAQTLQEISKFFNKTPKDLAYVLYKLTKEEKYFEFEIPKKSGGSRKIKAPIKIIENIETGIVKKTSLLLLLQQDLLKILNEIYPPENKKYLYKCVQGCLQGNKRGIINNAKIHSNKNYLVNIDIKNFFPSINFGRVRGVFKANPYNFSDKSATVLAQIATCDNELPVGSPCSPIIANMVASHLDYDILKYIRDKKISVKYTRYVDDMSFSCNKEESLKHIFDIDSNKINQELLAIIEKNNFNIQEHKTRYSGKTKRQEVTGLVCNEKVNVKKEFYQKVRNMVHNFYYNNEDIPENVIRGNLAFLFNVKKYNENKNNKNDNHVLNNLLWKYNLGRVQKRINDGKIAVLVEGPTDVIYLKAAFAEYKKSKPQNTIPEIIFMNLFCGKRSSGAYQINKFLSWITSNIKKKEQERKFENKGKLEGIEKHLGILNTRFVIVVDNDDAGKSVENDYKNNKDSLKNITGFLFPDKKFLQETEGKKKSKDNSNVVIEDLLVVNPTSRKSNYIDKLKQDNDYTNIVDVLKNHKSTQIARLLVKNYEVDYSNFFSLFDKILNKN
ncbi:MAG: reverse transcriptase family protein [Alphaproteobacteria bacterium]|nr:reverse transcriptase family protein [Alphaproteobacteria bacterium]